MADTALPPETATAVNPASTRMGNQNDTSWAGWAISSFTNKITTARGEIQPNTNGVKTPSLVDSRPNSVPPPERHVQTIRQPPASVTNAINPPSTAIHSSFSAPEEAEDEAEDVMNAWGTMDDDEDSFFDAPTTTARPAPAPKSSVPFEDNGEPDFAGWLAAQSQSKAGGKKPLPKGLSKPTTTTTITASRPLANNRTATTGSVGTGAGAKKLAMTTTKPKPTPGAKKIDTKPKVEEESGDWDAWD